MLAFVYHDRLHTKDIQNYQNVNLIMRGWISFATL